MSEFTISPSASHYPFFANYGVHFSLPPPPKVKKPSKLTLLWRRIEAFFINASKACAFWRKETDINLSKRQIKLIKEAKRNRKFASRKFGSLKPADLKLSPINQAIEIKKRQAPKEPTDKSLIRLKGMLEGFSQVLIHDVLFTDKIKPLLPGVQSDAQNGVSQVKSWVEVIANIKETAAPLIKKIGNLDNPLFTIAFQQLLQILLEQPSFNEDARKEIETALTEKISILQEHGEITSEQHETILTIIQPMLNWLFNSNNWLINTPHPIQLHHFFIDCINFFDAFSTNLENGKFDTHLQAIKQGFSDNFEEDVKEALELNTKPIAALLTNRLAELIDNIPFAKTFDELLKTVLTQTEGWMAGNAAYKQYQTAIKEAEYSVIGSPTNSIEADKQRQAESLLKMVQADGGVDSFLTKEFHFAYSEHPACHAKIKQQIGTKNQNLIDILEEEQFQEVVNKVYRHLLPPEVILLPSGAKIEIDGISKILEEIQLPENFKSIEDQLMEVFKITLETGVFKDKENFKQYSTILFKVILVELLQNQVKAEVTKWIRSYVNTLCSQNYLDELAGHLILPALVDKIFESWTRATINRYPDKIVPYMYMMMEHPEDVEEAKNELIDELYELMKKQTIDFSMRYAAYDRTKFQEVVQPVVVEIFRNLLKRLKGDDPLKKLSASQVKAALIEYFKDEPVPINPLYGKLTMNALFKVGNFGGWFKEKVMNMLIDTINESASIGMHDVTSSHHLLVESIVEGASPHLLDPSKVKELLFKPELTKIEQEAQQKHTKKLLEKNIYLISSLTHDTIYRTVEMQWGGFMFKHGIPKTSSLEELITDVYDKLFKDPVLNKSLLLKAADIVDAALSVAEENLRAKQTMAKKVHVLST